MPDIFISYKKEERQVAAQLATRLTEAGYDVWWDAALLAGDRFEDEIASVLRASRAVIVLWSKRSVASDWVKAEAETARAQKKALPAVIDDVPMDSLPLLFRGIHAVRLEDWSGDEKHPGYSELMASVAERLGAASGPVLSAPQAEAKLAENVSEAEIWSAVASSADQSAAEYRAYLKQFGPNARFAELAEIRIARLEEREKEDKLETKRIRRKWAPAIVLPLLALLIIAGAGATLWLRGDFNEWLIPQPTREAAARCAKWSASARLEWRTTLPALEDNSAADCELAEATWPNNGDYKAMLAMVRVVQGADRADDGIALARKSIDLGSALGNYVMGVMYNYGLKLAIDLSRAATYYQTAYKLGSADAAGRLCYMAENNGLTLPFSATLDEIYALCSASNDKGSAIGQGMMGYIYEYGDFGKPVDDIKAAEFYTKAAEQGNPLAKIQLGSVLIRGTGIKRDPVRAVSLFEEAMALGYPEAMRWLAIAHELGLGVEPDIPYAGQLYDKANLRLDTVSHYLLGYTPNENDDRGDFTRRELGRLSNEQSMPVGQRVLAVMQQFGIYVAQNRDLSFATLAKCKDANTFCQLVLGAFHRFGPQQYFDNALSVELFEKAAAAGEMHAQYQMAQLYEIGDGVPVDLARARELYQLALAQGYEQAASDLDRLDRAGNSTKL